jgi:DNA-binding transcriptional MerR regulator
MEDQGLMRISECARRLGVSAQYIRFLEAEGKIPPARRFFGERVFSQSDVDRLKAMGIGSGQRLRPFAEVGAGV